MDYREKSYVSNPRETANPISKLFFWWVVPLLWKGSKKDLVLDDIYNVPREDAADRLGNELGLAWDKEIRKSKAKGRKPKLYRAIIAVFGWPYFVRGICVAINEWTVRVAQVMCLKWLIESFSVDPDVEVDMLEQGLYAGGICATTYLAIFMVHPSIFGFQHIGMKIRIATSSLIYRKTLRVSTATQDQASVGHLVNLLSNDVSRFDVNLFMLHYFYIGPIQAAILTYLLWLEFGVSSLAGTGFILLLTPIQYYIGKFFAIFRSQIAERTDYRGKIMNEIIIGVRVIKMYAWEKPFSHLIAHVRRLEVKILKKAAHLRGFYLSFYYSSAKLISFSTFLMYVLIDGTHVLTADKVFFAVAIHNVMRQIMVSFVPAAAAAAGELIVATRRIEKFLLMKEQESGNMRLLLQAGVSESGEEKVSQPMIKLENACASWTDEKVTLDDLNISLEGDQLVIVCGPVGSGKTSLLNALIAELPITKGTSLVQGKTTYAAQEAWVFSGSLRQNILFGHGYDEARYRDIVRVCALEDDLRQLSFGENTIVGDRGVSLSGGQKARINLARALYEPADIYFLDDPLSAVDSRVSRHIFEKCIKTHLQGSLRILVTHQLQYLPRADHIIVLQDGKVLAQGTYSELVKRGINFVSLMATETQEDSNNRKESKSTLELLNAQKALLLGETKDDEVQDSQQEKMATGSVGGKIFWKYFDFAHSWFGFAILSFVFLFNQVLYNGSEIWLSNWTTEEEQRALDSLDNSIPIDEDDYLGRDMYIYVYSAWIGILFFLTTARGFYFFHFCLRISINVHNKMFTSVIRAPTKFFDENPSGRIMNRFTKDLGAMDELLPATFFDALSIFLTLIGVLVVVIISNYYMAIPTVFLLTMFWFMRRFYIRTARDVKRIESISRSPIFTHLTASVQGLTTIRTSKSQIILTHQFDAHQDLHSAAWYIFIGSNRWFAIWLELISATFLTVVTVGFLLSGDSAGGNVGLAISSILTLTGSLQYGMRQSAETENLMTSVERAIEYVKLAPEAELEATPEKKPPSNWPTAGKIECRHLGLAYKDKPVLKDLSFVINEKEKVGIVGRTGAGKSSIITALFRMVEPSGNVYIDGIDITQIGLHDLRRHISIIPQDPVLFSGTIRYNLDPFEQFNDTDIWESITKVDLKEEIPSLDFRVSDGGSNFSIGQRQLVCLARALLRNNRIIVMDEATANVDPRTDSLIQKTIREKFHGCTIITIAHRLHSVMDCDKILVLDHGELKEYDAPHKLLQNPSGILTAMVGHTGKASSELLHRLAFESYSGRNDVIMEQQEIHDENKTNEDE